MGLSTFALAIRLAGLDLTQFAIHIRAVSAVRRITTKILFLQRNCYFDLVEDEINSIVDATEHVIV